jgi:hypothetical protein
MGNYGFKREYSPCWVSAMGKEKRDKKSFVSRKGRREMGKYVLGQCHFGQSLS